MIEIEKPNITTVNLSDEAFEFYSEAADELALRHGRYQLLYGGSSLDADLKAVDVTV
mgnify:CR=1 FL=1